jgi:hypothetical protein
MQCYGVFAKASREVRSAAVRFCLCPRYLAFKRQANAKGRGNSEGCGVTDNPNQIWRRVFAPVRTGGGESPNLTSTAVPLTMYVLGLILRSVTDRFTEPLGESLAKLGQA